MSNELVHLRRASARMTTCGGPPGLEHHVYDIGNEEVPDRFNQWAYTDSTSLDRKGELNDCNLWCATSALKGLITHSRVE